MQYSSIATSNTLSGLWSPENIENVLFPKAKAVFEFTKKCIAFRKQHKIFHKEEALKGMDWDDDMLDIVLDAWSQVKELPEYPGSYYVSRSIYQGFWNVVENNKNPKDYLLMNLIFRGL